MIVPPRSCMAPAEGSVVEKVKAGDRVRLTDPDDPEWPELGTVLKVSPAGYVQLRWDGLEAYCGSYLSPRTAQRKLEVVTGEDARPRHDWNYYRPDGTEAPIAKFKTSDSSVRPLSGSRH